MSANLFPRMHVSLYVSDLQKSIEFYNSFFGVTPTKIKPAYAKYVLENPSLIISFVENKERVQSNFGHLGFQVETLEDLNIKLWEAKRKTLFRKKKSAPIVVMQSRINSGQQTPMECNGKFIIFMKTLNSTTRIMNPTKQLLVALLLRKQKFS